MHKTKQWSSKEMQIKLDKSKQYLRKRNICATEVNNHFQYTTSCNTNIAKTFAKFVRSAK